MPEGAAYVGRPSRWGNRWIVGDTLYVLGIPDGTVVRDAAHAAELFRARLAMNPAQHKGIRDALRGRDLCCWCPLDQPCHADVLLEIANAPEEAPDA